MFQLRQGVIQKKLTWMILFIVSIVLFLGYALFISSYFSNQKKESIVLSQTIAEVISQDLAKLVLLNKISTASDIATKLESFKHINRLVLYKTDGVPIYQYSKNHKVFNVDPLPENRQLSLHNHHMIVFVDALYQQMNLGYILVDINVKTLNEIIKENILLFLAIYIFMIFFSYLLANYFSRKFTTPIRQLVDFLQEIQHLGSLNKRLEINDKNKENEFGVLYQKVNLMLDSIDASMKDKHLAAVAFETSNGMIITDANMKVLQINQSYTKITGFDLEDVVGKKPSVLQSKIEEDSLYIEISNALEEKNIWSGEIQNYKKNGKIFSEYLTIQKVYSEEMVVSHYIFSLIDITQQKEAEEKVAFLMQYDPITGLANKDLLIETLTSEIDKSITTQNKHFLLSFDIKDFKIINDAYGYEVGDALLQEVSKRLTQEFSEANMMVKIGIDEFILSYRNVEDKAFEPDYFAKIIAEYMLSIMEEPFTIEDKTIFVALYIGINVYTDSCLNVDTILKNTNIALQLAKEKDEKIVFFDQNTKDKALYHIDTYAQLKKALKENEFELYYQPQYNQDKVMMGAEALIRWKHPEEGILLPYTFMPIAEKTGLIVQMGEWVLEQACQQLVEWQKNPKTTHLSLAINISAKQFKEQNFVEKMIEIIEKYTFPLRQLKFELVESILIEEMSDVVEKMKILKTYGIKIAMDDFGTGYSSLEYLKNLPLDQIKIDRSFVKDMRKNPKDLALVKSMILLGQAFEFEVIAEGIEEEEDFILLKELECYCFQGYYFAKPLNIEDFNKEVIL